MGKHMGRKRNRSSRPALARPYAAGSNRPEVNDQRPAHSNESWLRWDKMVIRAEKVQVEWLVAWVTQGGNKKKRNKRKKEKLAVEHELECSSAVSIVKSLRGIRYAACNT